VKRAAPINGVLHQDVKSNAEYKRGRSEALLQICARRSEIPDGPKRRSSTLALPYAVKNAGCRLWSRRQNVSVTPSFNACVVSGVSELNGQYWLSRTRR